MLHRRRSAALAAVILSSAPACRPRSDTPTAPAASAPTPTCPPEASPDPAPAFDARAAWDELRSTFEEEYAYLDRTDFDVPAQLDHLGELAVAAPDAAAFRAIVHRGGFAFCDPHLIVGPLTDDDPNVFPTSSDLVVERRDDAWVIADVRQDSPADHAEIRPGWTLVSIDGKPVDEAVESIWQGAVLARTPAQRAYAATLAANGRRTGKRTLELSVDGTPHRVVLDNPRAFADAVASRALASLERRGDIGVIRLENSLGERELIAAFDTAIEKLADTRGLVLDLRNTPSGGNTDTARAVIGHFVSEIRPYQVHEIPAVERATTVPRRFVEQVFPRAPRYAGRVAVLGGHWTGSMGEGLVIGMHGAAGARTFGSDMGDLLGGLYNFDLPRSGARFDLGAERLLHVDGTPREDFVADVPLPSADRDADGGDPAMAAALAWLKGA